MLANPAIQSRSARAWRGSTAYSRSIRDWVSFAFSFEVVTAITTDAVYKVQSAPANAGNPCAPGSFTDVAAIATCMGVAVPAGTLAQVSIPAGTPVGSLCSATIPCRPNEFLRLAAVSGDTANVEASFMLHGPTS